MTTPTINAGSSRCVRAAIRTVAAAAMNPTTPAASNAGAISETSTAPGIARIHASTRFVGVTRRLPPLGWERERWICTDAVLLGLERNVRGFAGLRELPLDWCELHSGTTNDLLTLSRLRPDLLAPV